MILKSTIFSETMRKYDKDVVVEFVFGRSITGFLMTTALGYWLEMLCYSGNILSGIIAYNIWNMQEKTHINKFFLVYFAIDCSIGISVTHHSNNTDHVCFNREKRSVKTPTSAPTLSCCRGDYRSKSPLRWNKLFLYVHIYSFRCA